MINRLKINMARREAALRKRDPIPELPEYGLDGKVKKRPKRERRKAHIILSASVTGALLCALYLPALFSYVPISNDLAIKPDTSAFDKAASYIQSNLGADWDEDGLSNEEELQYGTNPYLADSDNDGISDFAELKRMETDPLKSEKTLIKAIKKQDKEAGNEVYTPYKTQDVILWADDYRSKVYGGTVRTRTGYRFTGFAGWAQFSESGYAYRMENEARVLLEYRKTENAWRIDGDCDIEIYQEPLEPVYRFRVFGKWKTYLPDGITGKILSAILPDDTGILTCKKMTKKDTWADTLDDVTAPAQSVSYDESDLSRFGRNQNTLEDLARVYQTIDDGHTVLCSLYSKNVGEIIVTIYGYTAAGDLLMADSDTLEPIGELSIMEQSSRMMDQNGEIIWTSGFHFKGCGYDSKENGDRIAFFAASVG